MVNTVQQQLPPPKISFIQSFGYYTNCCSSSFSTIYEVNNIKTSHLLKVIYNNDDEY